MLNIFQQNLFNKPAFKILWPKFNVSKYLYLILFLQNTINIRPWYNVELDKCVLKTCTKPAYNVHISFLVPHINFFSMYIHCTFRSDHNTAYRFIFSKVSSNMAHWLKVKDYSAMLTIQWLHFCICLSCL